jgi:hypothetical protein
MLPRSRQAILPLPADGEPWVSFELPALVHARKVTERFVHVELCPT